GPRKSDRAIGQYRAAAGQGPAQFPIGIDIGFYEGLAAVMGRGDPDLLGVVVGDVDVLTADCEDGFIGGGIGAVGDNLRPGRAEVGGFGHDHVALVVLDPGGVDGAAIQRVDGNLRVPLRAAGGASGRRCPGGAVVGA